MKNGWTIGKKLIMAFLTVSVITLLLGISGYYGAVQSGIAISELGEEQLPSVDSLFLIRVSADNIRGTLRTMALPGISEEERRQQHNNIARAREQYAQALERYEAIPQDSEEAALWNRFLPAWNAWRQEYDKYLELMTRFEEFHVLMPARLAQQLEAMLKEHYELVEKILGVLYMDKPVFDGGDDHNLCNAGHWAASFQSDNPIIKSHMLEFAEPHHLFHNAVKRIKQLAMENRLEEARIIYQEDVTHNMIKVRHALDGIQQIAGEATAALSQAEEHLLSSVRERQETAINYLEELLEHNRLRAEDIAEKDIAQATLLKTISIIAMFIGVAVALSLGILISRSINNSLRRIASTLGAGAEQTASAAGQVSQSSQSMAEGASEQASSLEETSASLEEMTSMTKQNAENANQASNLMALAKETVGDMARATEEMSKAITEIKSSSDETAKIIKTIDEIAFQTNLLALNAAVEAARAGDAGKGFAVVAEEVRNLAQRSAEAARNTAEMIAGSVKNADNGVQVTDRVSEALKHTVTNSEKVAQLVAEIAAASNEQAQGIEQINTAVAQMDQVTQSNAANSEESASASEELSAQAEEMQRMVMELVTMVGGNNGNGDTHGKRIAKTIPVQRASQPRGATMKQIMPDRRTTTSIVKAKQVKNVIEPELIIPLDNDDLEDF